MKTRMMRLVLCSLLLAFSSAAEALPAKIEHIGVIHLGGPFTSMVDGLRTGLKELGLQEGKQIVFDIQDLKGDANAAGQAAKKFEQDKARLIYAVTTPVVSAAMKATKEIPIVFSVGSDPVAFGLIQSFPQPGGRLTGVHFLARDLTAKRLQILKEILPKLRVVVTFYDPGNGVSSEGAKLGREEARRAGLKFVERPVRSIEELHSSLSALKRGEFGAYFYIADPMVVSQAQTIITAANSKKLATMFHDQSLVVAGGLASYGQSFYEIGRMSAKYVQRVLSGTPPRDLRVETMEDVDLTINLQTAKQLGLTIPLSVLSRASKVIR
jgi:putative ABC transport system substrate-binding protein